jgi:hypothetical protein
MDDSRLAEPLDVLFLQTGEIDNFARKWSAFGALPDDFPPAKQYWFVFRFNRQQVPDLQVVPMLQKAFAETRETARQRHIEVAGIQLDIDSPTRALPQYAVFLREVKKGLPAGEGLSITALLDWFRDGTSINGVIEAVDEFVPQFYDAGDARDGVIAAKLDPSRWAPVFNRFHQRYRIGISTFGRARLVPKDAPPSPMGGLVFADLSPLEIGSDRRFTLEQRRSDTGELVLNYRASQAIQLSYRNFQPGDTIQFILSTPDSVRAAVTSARQMNGSCAGVVFFRWPASNETLAMQPADVLAAAASGPLPAHHATLHLVDGGCAAVKCMDVYLIDATPYSPKAARYKIHVSTALDYFLPGKEAPAVMLGPSELAVEIPPFSGRSRLYLGRAVTKIASQFTLGEQP